MTRDNVTISIDTSVYFKITNPRFALFRLNFLNHYMKIKI
jgi:regulator of protease activity HflC (stomatin/prohibitin superfamily)